MEQKDSFFAGDDTEQTVVAPRFDDNSLRGAHRVVPLAEHPAPGRRRLTEGGGRPWLLALIVAALAAATVGGIAIGRRQTATTTNSFAPSAETINTPTPEPDLAVRPARVEGRAESVRPRAPVVSPDPEERIDRRRADDEEERHKKRGRRAGGDDDEEKEDEYKKEDERAEKALKRLRKKELRRLKELFEEHTDN